jgi:hypothetical protein
MVKQIIIRYCNDCPYFINNSGVSHYLTDFCGYKLEMKPIEKGKKKRTIPSWCPLKDYKKGK